MSTFIYWQREMMGGKKGESTNMLFFIHHFFYFFFFVNYVKQKLRAIFLTIYSRIDLAWYWILNNSRHNSMYLWISLSSASICDVVILTNTCTLKTCKQRKFYAFSHSKSARTGYCRPLYQVVYTDNSSQIIELLCIVCLLFFFFN